MQCFQANSILLTLPPQSKQQSKNIKIKKNQLKIMDNVTINLPLMADVFVYMK